MENLKNVIQENQLATLLPANNTFSLFSTVNNEIMLRSRDFSVVETTKN